MEHMDKLLEQLPEAAKDVKLGLKSLLAEEGSPGLTNAQIWGAALSVATTLRHPGLKAAIEEDGAEHLGQTGINAAQTAAAIMGMTNIYYHTVFHLMKDDVYRTMPAGIRMNEAKSHGYDATSYEVFALAASVIGQCGNCINAHEKQLKAEGLSTQAVQSIVRLASTLNSTAMMLRQ